MIDTRSISDDQRRSGISLCFLDRLHILSLVGTHGHLCHIYITIRHRHHTQVFFTHPFTAGSKFSNSTCRSRFRRLTSGIGINLGIYHQNIYIFTAGQDMVDTTVTDIISPSVTTKDPLRFLREVSLQF